MELVIVIVCTSALWTLCFVLGERLEEKRRRKKQDKI